MWGVAMLVPESETGPPRALAENAAMSSAPLGPGREIAATLMMCSEADGGV